MARSKGMFSGLEGQTRVSAILAGLGAFSAVALVYFVFSAFNAEDFAVRYAAGSLRFYAVIGATGAACLSSGIAFLISLGAAGEKRNSLSSVAWLAFFGSAACIAVALSTFAFFWLTKEAIILGQG